MGRKGGLFDSIDHVTRLDLHGLLSALLTIGFLPFSNSPPACSPWGSACIYACEQGRVVCTGRAVVSSWAVWGGMSSHLSPGSENCLCGSLVLLPLTCAVSTLLGAALAAWNTA